MRRALAVALCACLLCGCDGNGVKRDFHDETADGRFAGESSTYEYETVTDTRTGVVYLIWKSGDVAIVTDTRTGVQYLAWNCGYGGGICVLVDADGKPMLAGDGKEQ